MTTARDILAAKIALEDELMQPLGYVLSSYIEAWANSEGQMRLWDQTGYRAMIERVLLRHYARTLSVMAGIAPDDKTTIDAVVLSPAHAERLRYRAHNQALHMVNGMERDLARAMASMHVLPIGKHNGTTLEQKKSKLTVSIAARFKETARQAWAKIKSRMRAIVNVETQTVAEEYQVEWVKQKHANARIYKTWNSLMDGREREWHHEAHEQTVLVSEPFIVGDEELMQPGDASRGASLANLINCFPGQTVVSGAVLAATRHWFDGEIVEVVTRGGHKLAATPNHPVLTPKGWVAIGALDEGDDLIRAGMRRGRDTLSANATSGDLNGAENIDDIEPMIEQVFDALAVRDAAMRKVGLTVDFHGDIPAHDVDIVGSDRVLWTGVDASILQCSHKFSLGFSDFGASLMLRDGLAAPFGGADTAATAGGVGSGNNLSAVVKIGLGHSGEHAFASVARHDADVGERERYFGAADPQFGRNGFYRAPSPEHGDDAISDLCPVAATAFGTDLSDGAGHPEFPEPSVNRGGGNAGLPADVSDGHPFEVQADRIVSVRRKEFSGHVFNLQTVHGIYHANGFVVHNCRCYTTYELVHNETGETIPIPLQTPALPAKRRWHPGDRLGVETPVRATESITMTGRTRANVVLGDGRTFAVMEQVMPDTVVVRVGGRDVARATFQNGVVTTLTTAPDTAHLDLDGLIRRSVAETEKLRQRQIPRN